MTPKACPFYGFDLSNSGESFDPNVGVSSRIGYYRLATQFSESTTCDLMAVYFMEYSGSLNIDRDGLISRSYVVWYQSLIPKQFNKWWQGICKCITTRISWIYYCIIEFEGKIKCI